MDKQATVDHNRRAIAVLRKHGRRRLRARSSSGRITTRADWDRLKRFIDETGLYYLNVSPLTPMPGTKIWEQYQGQLIVGRPRPRPVGPLAHGAAPPGSRCGSSTAPLLGGVRPRLSQPVGGRGSCG